MMKVVEYGNMKPRTVKCKCCGAKLEFTPQDLKYWYENTYYLVCPICSWGIYYDDDGNCFVWEA